MGYRVPLSATIVSQWIVWNPPSCGSHESQQERSEGLGLLNIGEVGRIEHRQFSRRNCPGERFSILGWRL
jgi:hypothetical protein